ncbi:uncharacterized protein [Branchiostoma lanceolatum]|uniref:uncharacterized protein n=1 Tax=Branchiostoma lanceolatum TaxID=7740 RepID=UPI00345456F9
MAAAPSSLGTQICEELSCSICLELFTRPKVLPCQHTFCQDCLQDLASRRVPLQCPNCRQQVRLPPQGVASLPDNLMAASMCERLQNQATLSGETREQLQSGNRCSFHPSEVLKVYCKQCHIPVCDQCLEETHDDHRTTTIKKAAQERSSTVQALINEGRNILESYLSFLRSLRGEEKTLTEQKQQRDNSIIQTYNQMVKTMMQKLTESKDHLLSESQQNHSKNLEKIQTERDRVLADLNELSAACDRAEQELQQGWVEFLSQQTALTGVVGKYRGKAAPTPVQTQPAVFQPTDTPVPVLGHVTAQSLPSAPIPAAPAPIPQAPAPIPAASAPIPAAPALIPAAPAPIPAAPAASFGAARGRGHHHGNQRQWEHQPQNVTFGKGGSGTGQFDQPRGVTVSDEGEIFVADWGNERIQVFTLQGTFVRQFPTVVSDEKKMEPSDVAMDGEGNLWVVGKTRSDEFAVQYDKQGRVLGKFDLQKTRWFRGVAVDTRRNHILITQTTGGRGNSWHGEVQVFRPDGTLVRTVGQQQGMENPWHITVDGEGNILVSDYDNNCVYVYNEDGQFLFQFGGEGSGEGQLYCIGGICTDRAGNIIVVNSGNSRVEMFDKTGKFLKHIVTDMVEPLAVAMAKQGQLVVTNIGDNTVSVGKRNCDLGGLTSQGQKVDNKMAAASSNLGTQFREELSCSICLELFTRPKMLLCGHTFCLSPCLENVAGREGTIKCPNCRQQGKQGNNRAQSGDRCSFHPSEEVKLYCKQCNVPVCTECCEEGHDGHPTTGLKKAAQRRSLTVQALINEGRNIMESYLSFLRSLRGEEKTLNEQKQQRDNRIIQTYNQTVQTMVQALTQSKDLLLSESQQNHSENFEKIQTERDRVLADLNELSAACDRAEQELQQGWVEFLSQETALTEVVGKYREKAAPTPVQTKPAVFQPTDATVPVLGHVTIQSLPSAPIPAAPAPIPAAPAPIPAAPAPIPAAPASGTAAARARGHHLDDYQRQGEPQSQKVTFGGEGSGTGQFHSPCGVTVSDEGEIFVTDRENQRIQVFTLQGTFVRQFPTVVSCEQKMGPDDVAMDGEGNLWVVGITESAEFAVQYNKQGRALRKIDLQKTRQDRRVAVDTRRNHILITHTTGHWPNPHGEVLAFRPDGTVVGTVGQQQGMKHPRGITVDREGNILVSDYDNDCVFVYNGDGQLLFQFGGDGSGEGQLEYPHGICTDGAGNIIVADRGNSRVELFDKTGKLLKHITTDMDRPCAVAMATQGQLVVTEEMNHTVSICPTY